MTNLNSWGANLSGALAGDKIIYDGTRYVRFNPVKHDFYALSCSTDGTSSTSGTGATTSNTVAANYYSTLTYSCGTTTSGYSGGSFNRLGFPSAAKVSLSFNIKTHTSLSDATNEYEYNVGAWVGTINAPTDGFYFKYLRTSNTNWLCSTIASSTETATDSSVVVAADTIYNMRMIYDSTTPSVKFYLDDVLVATNTTNVPTTGTNFVRLIVKKSAGTSSRSIQHYSLNLGIIRD